MAKGRGSEVHVEMKLEIFPDRIDRLINTPDGPVGLHVKAAADRLLQIAIKKIGKTYSGHHGSPLLKDSGVVQNIGGSTYAVVFNHPIAFLHHQGAEAHTMAVKDRAAGDNPYYRRRPAGYSFGPTWKSIDHPGSNANPYLTQAANDLGLRPSGTLLRGRNPAKIFRLRPI